jgi:hypothetical protein
VHPKEQFEKLFGFRRLIYFCENGNNTAVQSFESSNKQNKPNF